MENIMTEPLLFLTGTTTSNSSVEYVRIRACVFLSGSIINAVVFLFACFFATWSSPGDAFLMIQERRDEPCGFWGRSIATEWTVTWIIANPHLPNLDPC